MKKDIIMVELYKNYKFILGYLKNYDGENYVKAKTYMEIYLQNYVRNYNAPIDNFQRNLIGYTKKFFDKYMKKLDTKIDNLKIGKDGIDSLEYLMKRLNYIIEIYITDDNDKKLAKSLFVKSIIGFPNNRKYDKNYQIVEFIHSNISKLDIIKNTDIKLLNDEQLLNFLIAKNYYFVYKYINKGKYSNYKNAKIMAEKSLYYIIKDSIQKSNINSLENDISKKLDEFIESIDNKRAPYKLEFLSRHNDKYALHKTFEMNKELCDDYAMRFYKNYLELLKEFSCDDKKIVQIPYEDIKQEIYVYAYKIIKQVYLNSGKVIISIALNNNLKFHIKAMLNKVKKDLMIDNVYDDSVINIYDDIESNEQIIKIKDQLSQKKKKLFDLLMIGYDSKEISNILKINEYSARSEMSLVRKNVKSLYKK